MASTKPGESSEAIRSRVIAARAIQAERYKNEKGIYCNAQMNSRLLHQYAWPDETGMKKLKERMTRLNMSARAFDRILRTARTIADLDYANQLSDRPIQEIANQPIKVQHIAEAIGYRSLDRANYGQTY